MPFVKCRFYDEKGEPVRGGCHKKDAGCNFIHPDDPNWASAREPSFRRDSRGGDTNNSWDRGRRNGPPPPLESHANATDAGSGWDTGGGWDGGGWKGSGWGGGGWDTGESASAPASAQSKGQSTWGTPSSANPKSQTEATSAGTDGGQGGWGGGWGSTEGGGWGNDKDADKTTGSGTGSSGDNGSGSSGWGNNQNVDKPAGSGTGSSGDSGWGSSGWGNNQNADKPVGSGTGSSGDNGWGSSGWGNNQNADKPGTGSSGDNGWGSSGWGNNQNANKPAGSGTGSSGDNGWGSSGWGNNQNANKPVGSGTRSSGDNGWGASGWGNNQNADKTDASGTGSTGNNGSSGRGDKETADKNVEPAWGSGSGSGWGNNKDSDKNAGSAWGSTQNEGGSGWGNDDNASWKDSQPMVVDNQAEKASGQGRGRGRTVIAPPRIRIPDNEHKRARPTGTNNEPLGLSKWGESRPSLPALPTPLTPVATSTPTESTRGKRKRDAALDDKYEIFREYIKTWERAVRAKFLLAEAEAKRDRWYRTQKSTCYARVGEAGRDKLDGQRAECDKEHKAQWDKLNGTISLLMDFHDKLASNLDLGQRYNTGEETQRFISESKAFVDETRALLVARVLKEKDEGQPSDVQKQPSDADPSRVDSLQSRIQQLEERFEQAQTELTLRQKRDVRPEIDELLNTKIQTLRVARQQEIDHVASKPRPEIVIPPNALRTIEGTAQRVSEMETKVPHTVEDIRVLLFRVDAMTKRVNQLEEEVSVSKETYRKVEGMAAEKEKVERQMDQKLQDIQGQFQQLVASQPPATAAQTPTTQDLQERLMESLQPLLEAVLSKFYEVQVLPAVEAVQQLAIKESTDHQKAAISMLWGRMKPAMSMVEGVSRWLDSYELGLTAPVEEDPMSVADR